METGFFPSPFFLLRQWRRKSSNCFLYHRNQDPWLSMRVPFEYHNLWQKVQNGSAVLWNQVFTIYKWKLALVADAHFNANRLGLL